MVKHEGPQERAQRHFKARRGAAWELAEVLREYGDEIPDECAEQLVALQDQVRPGTDREEPQTARDDDLDVDPDGVRDT